MDSVRRDDSSEQDGAANAPKLAPDERRQVQERSAMRTAVVYETIREEGEFELSRPTHSLWWSGLAAGLSMGFSFIAEAELHHHLPDEVWRPLISGFGYSVGFLVVILGRQQLFTENTLTVILPLLVRKNLETLRHVARLWSIVLVANVVGAFVFAAALVALPVLSRELDHVLLELASKKLENDASTLFVRAIFAGWIIALMLWLLPAAHNARVAVIIIATYLIALGGFPHIIAGSVEVFYATLHQPSRWSDCLAWGFPTLLGNICGGVALVSVLAYAQIRGSDKNND